MGFLPGIVYDSLQDFENNYKDKQISPDDFLLRYDDTVVDFKTKIPYPYVYGNSMADYHMTF